MKYYAIRVRLFNLENLIKNAVESIERAHEADTQERKTGYQGEVRLITKFRSGVRRRQSSGAVQRDVNAHGKQLPIEVASRPNYVFNSFTSI